MNGLPQPQPTPQPDKQPKLSFYGVFLLYNFYEYSFQELAKLASVDNSVVEQMFVNFAVRRQHAAKVLLALSRCTGATWSLENVMVVLMPTFQDLHTIHKFDLDTLAKDAGVPYAVLDMMLTGTAVSAQDAMLVLQTASRIASEHFTFKTVDVPLSETGD